MTNDAATADDIAEYRRSRSEVGRFQPTSAGHPIMLELKWAFEVMSWANRDGGPSKWRTAVGHDGAGSGAERPSDEDIARARRLVQIVDAMRPRETAAILRAVAAGQSVGAVAAKIGVPRNVAQAFLDIGLRHAAFEHADPDRQRGG